MKKLRYIALLLAISVILSALSGCAAASVPAGVDEDGRFVYSVVRSSDAVSEAENGAKNIRSAIKDNFGCSVVIAKDGILEDFDQNYEILVGNTNREESEEALTRLKENRPNFASDFIVAVIGDKICIQAATNEMLAVATDWFVATFCQSLETWKLLKTDYQYIYTPESSVVTSNTVNNVDIALYSVTLPKQCSYLVGMLAEEFVDYFAEFGYQITEVEEGFDEHTQYEILFGDCEAEASRSVTVEGDNYVIKVVGDKIVIKGGNDLATNKAGKDFLNMLYETETTGRGFSWFDGHTINGKLSDEDENTYSLTWNDEFEGNTIDLNKWGDYVTMDDAPAETSLGGKGYMVSPVRDTYPGTLPKDYVYQSDGKMVMAYEVLGNDTIVSQIGTYNTMMYRYGIMEIRGKMPEEPATVSYWTNGGNLKDYHKDRFGADAVTRVAQMEVDLIETFGSTLNFRSNVHLWWGVKSESGKNTSMHSSMDGNAKYTGSSLNNKAYSYTEKYGDKLSDDYHIYTFYWDSTQIKFAFDGKVYCDYQFTENKSASNHCLMSFFLSGGRVASPTYGATYDRDIHPTYFEHKMDYIRFYQMEEQNCQMITAWPQLQEKGTRTVLFPNNDDGGTY